MRVASVLVLAALLLAGCVDRVAPRTVDGVAYGVTAEPFRNRWWQFYERGLSWAEGGFLVEAEADLRACLRLRETDRRRARTYGMHYVHCFAHRELGAVLLRQRRHDEAERELRQSMAQEPSAKAALLIGRLTAARTGAPPAPNQVALLGAVPAQVGGSVAIDRVEAAADGGILVSGHAPAGQLWLFDPAGTARLVPAAANGDFSAHIPALGRLAVGTQPEHTISLKLATVAAPELTIDGPADGDAPSADQVVYRWQGAGPQPLRALTASSNGRELVRLPLSGLRAAGMLPLPLPLGEQRLVLTLEDATGGTSQVTRTLHVRPVPAQDRRRRATALMVPAQPVRPGAMQATDDPRLTEALSLNARFRISDRDADPLAATERALADGGWVDATTVAAIGRREACRYALTATINRGRDGIECYLRVVHCASSLTVASADAYAEGPAAADAAAFFATVAARVRQSFPVLSGTLRSSESGAWIDLGSRHGVCALMLFYPAHDDDRVPPIEVRARTAERSQVVLPTPSFPDRTPVHSE